jgi:hypothetical protein
LTELVEYCLVVMVSTSFVAGSVVAYNAFSSFESGLQLRATFAEVSALAAQAVDEGSSRATLSLPASTIECGHDSLQVSTGPAAISESLPVDCDFSLNVGAGLHTILFTTRSAQLDLSVL